MKLTYIPNGPCTTNSVPGVLKGGISKACEALIKKKIWKNGKY